MSSSRINVLQFICPTGFYGAERWILALTKFLPPEHVRSDLAVTLEDNSRDLKLVRVFREQYGEAFEIPMSSRFDMGVIAKLVQLIRERDIHIIHTHGYKSDILGVIAARKAGIRCVSTPHGFENAKDLKLRLFIWLGCKAMSFADKVVPLSPQLMKDSRNVGVRQSKLEYIQNGVDLSEVDEQRRKPNPMKGADGTKRIGFVGQMISRKNIHDILDIFESISRDHDNLKLVFVGDGDQRKELEEYASHLDSRDRIEFLGFRDDRLELLQSFDLFVMTSTLEGIPRCLMEACAMGIPVAAYDIPGIDQLITHEQTGLLAPLKDKQTLQGYWERLLFDVECATKIAEHARDFVHTHYSANRMAREYLDLFTRLKAAP
jgi:glycosyltransferase involved in cell wall biosynthesis